MNFSLNYELSIYISYSSVSFIYNKIGQYFITGGVEFARRSTARFRAAVIFVR